MPNFRGKLTQLVLSLWALNSKIQGTVVDKGSFWAHTSSNASYIEREMGVRGGGLGWSRSEFFVLFFASPGHVAS